MKKVLLIVGMIVSSVLLMGQSWDHSYGYLPQDSILAKDSVQILVIGADPSGDTTFTMLVSDLNALWEGELNNSAGLASALSDETGTGVAVFGTSPTFTTGIAIGSADISEAEMEILDGATLTTTELNYVDGVTSAIQTQIDAKLNTADTLDANTQVWMLADTIVLGSFSKDTTTATGFYGSFYNGGSDTLVVTEMRAVLQGSSPSVTVDVQWHATFNSGSATDLNTTAPTITSTTTGDSDTSFDNSQIPPGVWVWMETPTINTAATYISVTLCGYRKNAAY